MEVPIGPVLTTPAYITSRLPPKEPWESQGACNGTDPAFFYPEPNEGRRRYEGAIQVCSTCPVKKQCLDFAVRTNQSAGVWGGRVFDRDVSRVIRLRRRDGTLVASAVPMKASAWRSDKKPA